MDAFFKKFFIFFLAMSVIQPSFSFEDKVTFTDTEEDRLGNVRLYSPKSSEFIQFFPKNLYSITTIICGILMGMSLSWKSAPVNINMKHGSSNELMRMFGCCVLVLWGFLNEN